MDGLRGPDVAVFRLAEGGPDLPEELPLATADEFGAGTPGALDGRAMGLLGYPADLADGWPTTRRPAWATLASGLFRPRLDEEAGGPFSPSPHRFWVDASLNRGASGGLIFLENGHVAGIISGAYFKQDRTWATMGTRVDALLELLRHHRLADLDPGPISGSGHGPAWENDPRLPRLREAVRKIGVADDHRKKGDYPAAGRLCNEVLEAFPGYGYAAMERSMIYSDYCDSSWGPALGRGSPAVRDLGRRGLVAEHRGRPQQADAPPRRRAEPDSPRTPEVQAETCSRRPSRTSTPCSPNGRTT